MELAQARVALVTAFRVSGNGVTVGNLGSNHAFERTVDALALARGRRGGQSASAARSRAQCAAAQREL